MKCVGSFIHISRDLSNILSHSSRILCFSFIFIKETLLPSCICISVPTSPQNYLASIRKIFKNFIASLESARKCIYTKKSHIILYPKRNKTTIPQWITFILFKLFMMPSKKGSFFFFQKMAMQFLVPISNSFFNYPIADIKRNSYECFPVALEWQYDQTCVVPKGDNILTLVQSSKFYLFIECMGTVKLEH